MIYADVIIDISHEKLDRDFQYRVPEELVQAIKPGVVVTVPFGKGNTLRKGYVTGISGTAKDDASKLKEIRGVSTDSETTESRLIALAAWMKETLWLHHDPGTENSSACKRQGPCKREKTDPFYREKGRGAGTSWQAGRQPL